MRNKTKKILAGLGIGLTLTGSGLLMTGCKSDIEFNQKDLDLAISNVNEYLETQNNYSSEFARNTLNGHLMNAMEDSLNTTNFKLNSKFVTIDAFGNKINEMCGSYKYFNNGNLIKEMVEIEEDENIELPYRETKINSDNTYESTTYNGLTKTYQTEKGLTTIEPLTSFSGVSSYSSAITFVNSILNGAYGLKCEDFIMEKIDNKIVFKTIIYSDDDSSFDTQVGSLIVEFTDGKITKVASWSSEFDYDSHREISDNIRLDEMIFEHNIEDFTFDKTGYTQA